MSVWSRFKQVVGWGREGLPKGSIARKSTTVVQLRTGSTDPEWVFSFDRDTDGDLALTASVWVGACVDQIIKRVRTVPLRVFVAGEPAPADHPLEVLLTRPNPMMSQGEWLARIAMHLTLGGENYVEKLRQRSLGASAIEPGLGLPGELWPWSRDVFEPQILTNTRRPVPKWYRPTMGNTDRVPRPNIIHSLYPRPRNVNEGLSPIEVAEREISIDSQATEWQHSSLRNRAIPDGVFKYVDAGGQSMSPEQFNEAQERIDSYWTDLQRNHMPFLLGSNLDFVKLSQSAAKLELIKGREFAMLAISAATGVPTVLFKSSGATFANLETANFMIWDSTVLPIVSLIVSDLNAFLAPEYGPDVTIEEDISSVDALLPIQERRWDVAGRALDRGVPFAEVNEVHRLGYAGDHLGADQGFVPTNTEPMSDALLGEPTP